MICEFFSDMWWKNTFGGLWAWEMGINMCKVGNITYESLSLVVVETADCGDVMNACSLLEKTLKISGNLFGIWRVVSEDNDIIKDTQGE